MSTASFANDRLTDAIKQLSADPATDANVKKKLLLILSSWKRQFQGDSKMTLVASLYDQCRPVQRRSVDYGPSAEIERRKEKEREKEAQRREKEEAKKRAKREKAELRERRDKDPRRSKRTMFNFEQEKPQVLGSIVNASQASSNLVNALMVSL